MAPLRPVNCYSLTFRERPLGGNLSNCSQFITGKTVVPWNKSLVTRKLFRRMKGRARQNFVSSLGRNAGRLMALFCHFERKDIGGHRRPRQKPLLLPEYLFVLIGGTTPVQWLCGIEAPCNFARGRQNGVWAGGLVCDLCRDPLAATRLKRIAIRVSHNSKAGKCRGIILHQPDETRSDVPPPAARLVNNVE